MKTLKYMALAAVAMLAACTANDTDTPALEGSFEAFVTAQHSGTRTSITADNSLAWKSNDVLGVYVDDIQNNRPFSRVENGFKGSFAYAGKSASATTFRAYYPYTAKSNGYVISANLPTEQNAEFDGSADFMVSDPLTAAYYEDKNISGLNFNFAADGHLFTVLRLTLTDGADKALASESISSILISSPGNALTGAFSVDMRDPANNEVTFADPKDYVRLTFENYRPTLASPITAYAVVRPTDVDKPIALTVDVMTSSGKATFTSPAVELKRSTVKEFPTIVVSDTWKKSESLNAAFTDPTLLQILLKECDANNNGMLTQSELSTITSLSIAGTAVRTLSGMELLTSLTTFDCSSTNITSLDLSGCSTVTDLNISSNSFSKVIMPKNSALQNLVAQEVQANKLDFTGCANLATADFAGSSIESLVLDGLTKLNTFVTGRINHLSAQNCKALTSLSVINIGLQSLNLTGCTSLTALDCYDNADLVSLTLKGCTALGNIMCRSCGFTSLDLSGLSALTVIYCQRGNLQTINLTGCVMLNNFYAHTNKWIEIDLSPCISIGSVNVKDSPTLTKIILPAGKDASIVNHSGSTPVISFGK